MNVTKISLPQDYKDVGVSELGLVYSCSLIGCGIGGEGARYLSEALQVNTSLHHLE